MNLVEIIEKSKFDKSIALKKGNVEISYEQLWNQVYYLEKPDQDRNGTVAILMDNSIEFVVAFFSALLNRKSVLLIPSELMENEVVEMLIKLNVNTIYSLTKYKEHFSGEYWNSKDIKYVDSIIPNVEFDAINDLKIEYELDENVDDEVAVIIPTSGTTSDKKFVQLTHKNIFSNVLTMNEISRMKKGEIELLSLPMTSGFCLTVSLLNCLYSGLKIVIYDGVVFPKRFFEMIRRENVNYFILVPSVVKLLSEQSTKSYFYCDSVKRISMGGEKLSESDMKQFLDVFKNTAVIYGYGMTECSPVVSTTTLEDYNKKIGTVGRPLKNVKVKVINELGETLSPYEQGEILVKGPNVMKGYFNSSDTIDDQGWLNTGDVGYLDNENYLFITGRKKNVIISAGKNIYPEEIEMVLLDSKLVKDVHVKGISDKSCGELVVADVVLSEFKTIDDVKKYCLDNLAYYKIPKLINSCNNIERNAMNKIIRK